MAAPEIPEREQVEAGAEAEFTDGKVFAAGPCFREPAAREENSALFRQPFAGEIDVAMIARERRGAVLAVGPVEIGKGRQAWHSGSLA
jgi:hypothetical protein